MTNLVGLLCILIAMLPLTVGYFQFYLPQASVISLGVGLLWLLLRQRRRAWVASLGLFLLVVMAGLGIWIGISPLWMAVSVLGSLCAWDLEGFSLRLRNAGPGDPVKLLEKKHLHRLELLAGESLVLILLANFLRMPISFGWMFLLTLAAVLGLMQLVSRLRRGE